MSDHINHLVICRKRTSLTQGDMARLMGLTEQSNVSRCETGEQIPSLRMILIYSIVLNVSVEELYHGYRFMLLRDTKERITALINELKNQKQLKKSKRIRKRMLYLTKILEGINKEVDNGSTKSRAVSEPATEVAETTKSTGLMNFF